jgi:RNA polymerase sigma-70 factor (ECF subfamily)
MNRKQLHIPHFPEELSARDAEAILRMLYESYAGRIMRYVRMYVKSVEASEELVSDVFYALWENRKTWHTINHPEAYIYKIAKFKILNYLRIDRPEYVDLDTVPVDLFARTETTPEDDFISGEMIALVNGAIEQLPAKSKLAFKLVREDGMKYREAAEYLGISVKTLEAHLTAAMKKISGILKENI